MIASKSPDPKRPDAAAATAAATTTAGAASSEELPLPSAPGAAAAAAEAAAAGGASRTTSTATTATADTANTANTAVSSVTFAADDAGGSTGPAANNNDDNDTEGVAGRRHKDPPSRSYASFASDTSFVIEHNDDDDDVEDNGDGQDDGIGTNTATNKTTTKTKKDQPIERIRHRFASHQTNHDHDHISSEGVGSSRLLPAVAPPPSAALADGRPPRSDGAAPSADKTASHKPPLGTGTGSTHPASHLLLLAPLRRHFASHSEEPSSGCAVIPRVLHAQPTPSPATQAALSNLIASKRPSLRPVELHFLEEVCRYGGEDEVRCAMERLEDDGLFFGCGGDGGYDDCIKKEEEEANKASPSPSSRRGSMVRKEKKLDGTSMEDEDDVDDDVKEEEEEEEDYTPADRALYTPLTASKVEAQELERRNRRLQEKCSILADDDDEDDDDGGNDNGIGTTGDDAKALLASRRPCIELRTSASSMYEPRAVHSNSLDPSESDLERLQSQIRSSSDGVAHGEETTTDDYIDDDDEDKNRVAARNKAKARKMWTKVGSAARMAALANRRAQHQHQHRTAAARSVTTTGSLPSEGTANAPGGGGIVDSVPGPQGGTSAGIGGLGESQTTTTSTSTSNIASIWRAHETGLSVTSLSSERRIDQKRRSMLQLAGVPTVGSSTLLTAPPIPNVRRSVSGGGGGGGTGSSRRAAYRNAVGGDSFLSVGSLGDVLVDNAGEVIGPTTHNAEEEDKVFRRQDEDAVFRSDGEDKADDKLEDSDDELFEDEIEEDPAGLNTSTASAPVPESPSKIARPAGIGASDGEGGMNRRSISVGSVRSVKFAGGHTLHEFSEDDMQFNKVEIPGDRPPPSRLPGRPPTILRRSSSLNRLPPSARRQVAVEMSRARLLSADVTPVPSPSASSIPSIRHAHPIRSDSAMSLGSVVSAAPSLNLHRANPLRSDSFISVGSAISAAPSLNLHRANPIRSNSVVSMNSAAPSLNLHRANPVRSQSFLSEIGDVGLQRNISVADSVLTFDESPITSPRASLSADEPEDEAIAAAKAAAAAAAAATKNSRPVMMRMASRNNYDGEGFEIADMVEDAPASPAKSAMLKLDSIDNARKYRSLLSEASESMLTVDQSFKAMPIDDFVRSSMFRRTLSDDGLYGDNDSNGDLFDFANENDDWDLESEPEIQDAWNVLQDEYAVGYSSIPFFILGTSADDVDCHPHVLSPPLMESLQPFFPYAVSEDNFYLKFSLVRDGASLHTLLQNARGAKHTIVAIETVEGEVFGAFCSSAWRKNWNYFGSGEAFLWRMRRGRDTHCPSIIDQAQMESELDVFPWTGKNNFVQLCTSNKIAIGGGTKDDEKKDNEEEGGDAKMNLAEGEQKTSWDMENSPPFGFGLAIEDNLLNGMSSPCLTFNSPPLSKKHSDGSPFEILNLEVWTLTPCNTVEEAEKLELSRLFLEGHRATSM